MPPIRRMFKGASLATTLAAGVTSSATTATLTAGGGSTLPDALTGPFVVTVNTAGTTEEKWLVATRSGDVLSGVTRGYDGTAASAHSPGEPVRHTISAVDLDDANAHTSGAITDPHAQYLNSARGVSTAGGSTITSSGVTVKGLVVKGASGQTANLAEWQDSTGTVLSYVGTDGRLAASGTIHAGGIDAALGSTVPLAALGTVAAQQVLVVRGAASQTANLAEFQNNAGTVLAGFDVNGALIAPVGLVTSSAPSGGGAGAVPSLPVGYMAIVISGTVRRVPFYA